MEKLENCQNQFSVFKTFCDTNDNLYWEGNLKLRLLNRAWNVPAGGNFVPQFNYEENVVIHQGPAA